MRSITTLNFLTLFCGNLALLTKTAQHWDNELAECHEINLLEITINQVHEHYRQAHWTSSQLTKCYLDRIQKLNPHLNAVIEINPDAMKIAGRLDKKWTDNREFVGNLHGIPILLKDNIGTKDKMNTTCGSWAMLGSQPKEDARVVQLLRRAGAIILGKTNLSEFGGFRSDETHVDGWSGRGGQTRNPYVRSETPGGSSSGSAVAVASNLAVAALGTETIGSINIPSQKAAVVGFKPSFHSFSSEEVIPLAPSRDTVGIITRTVDDNIIVSYAIAEEPLKANLGRVYSFDPTTGQHHFTREFEIKAGIIRDPYFNTSDPSNGLPSEQKSAINKVLSTAADKLAIVDVKGDFSGYQASDEFHIMATELNYYLGDYLTTKAIDLRPHPIRSLKDIVDYNNLHHPDEVRLHDQHLLETALEYPEPDDEEYLEILRTNTDAARREITRLLTDYHVDLLVTPNYAPLNPYYPSSLAGYPLVTIPIGIDSNHLPFGINLYGPPRSEPQLLMVAHHLATYHPRPRPHFLP